MAEQLKNALATPSCTLTSTVTAGVSTSFTVSAATNLPASGTFRLTFAGASSDGTDDAVAIVGAISGTTCSSVTWETVGAQTAFAVGAQLGLVITAAGLAAYVDENTPTTAQQAALDAAVSPSASNGYVTQREMGTSIGRRLLRKIQSNCGGTVLVLSDSTGSPIASPTGWVRQMSNWFAAQYPNLRVEYQQWANPAYPASTVIQAGSGSGGTLIIKNCSISGNGTQTMQAPYGDAKVAATGADLVFIAHSINDGTSVAAEPHWRNAALGLREWVAKVLPSAEIVWTTENPRTDAYASYLLNRRLMTMTLAAMRGDGIVDTYGQILDQTDGNPQAEPASGAVLQSDGVHPNQLGQDMIWDAVERAFRASTLSSVNERSQQPSSLLVPVTNHLANGNFADFTAPPTLPNWTANNCTLSKDTTNYETKGYGLRMQAAAAGSMSSITQSLDAATVRKLRGGWVTLYTRLYRAAVGTGQVGLLRIEEIGGSGAGSYYSNVYGGGSGGFFWHGTSRRIAADATGITIWLLCDQGTTGAGDCTLDRAVLVPGQLPGDIA